MKAHLIFLVFILFFSHANAQQNTYSFDENFVWEHQKKGRNYSSENLSNENHITNAEDGTWSNKFSVPGIVGSIHASGSDGQNLYIGGNFKSVGGIKTNNIVKWDGEKWLTLGVGSENGLDFTVQAITYANEKLFVGGMFSKAGSKEAYGLAYWDGANWHSVVDSESKGLIRYSIFENDTTILQPFVWELFVHNNKLYIGGDFDLAGDLPAKGVAVWDLVEEKWETLNGGLLGTYATEPVYAYAFTAIEDEVYVGGKFYSAGGVPAQHIAKWDGENWTALGEAEGFIYRLQVDRENNLYAQGYYNSNGANNESGIAKFDGSTWSSIPAPDNYYSGINRFKIYDDILYVGGSFEHKEGLTASAGFALWDGNDWKLIYGLGQTYNDFFLGGAKDIELINERMYLAGDFTLAGDLYVRNVVEWDESNNQWIMLDDGSANKGILDGTIGIIERTENGIIAAGSFHVAGGVYARNIAKWNGSEWESLGTSYNNGVRGYINDVLVDGNDIYVGGYFGSAGTVEAYHVAKWDGERWSSIGIGVGGLPGSYVNALAKVDNYLYVGGYFAVVGDEENYELPANSIARFNLITGRWESIGNGVEYNHGIPGIVYDLEYHDGIIYVGGWYNLGDGQVFQNIAALVDNKWRGIEDAENSGIDGRVYKVKVINDEIYIGGTLQPEKSGKLQGVMKWQKEGWTIVGERLATEEEYIYVSDIEPYANGFLAGGYFEAAGNTVVNNLAYFDGNSWNNFAGGIQPFVATISADEHSIYFAGPDVMATGDIASVGLANYVLEELTPISHENEEIPLAFKLNQNYPNPFNPVTNISYNIPAKSPVTIRVFDSLGRLVSTLVDELKTPGNYRVTFDGSNLSSGIYFYQMTTNKTSETRKLILLK